MSKRTSKPESKPEPKRLVKAAAVVCVVAALAACGSESSTDATSGSSVSTDGADSSSPPTSFDMDYMPESMVQMFAENSLFSTFAELVALTDLAPLFEADGEITVFVPGNAAFEKLPEGVLEKLKDPVNKELLTRLLSFHMLDSAVSELDIVTGTLTMKTGDTVDVEVGDQVGYLMNLKINGIPVVVGDIQAGKSYAHVLGDLLIPPGVDLSTL